MKRRFYVQIVCIKSEIDQIVNVIDQIVNVIDQIVKWQRMNKKAIGSTLNFDIDQIVNAIDQIVNVIDQVNSNKNCLLLKLL